MGIKTLLDGIKNLVSYGEGEGKWDMGELGQTLWQNRPTVGFAVGDNAGQVASHSAASKMAQRREQQLLSEEEKKANRYAVGGFTLHALTQDLSDEEKADFFMSATSGQPSKNQKINERLSIGQQKLGEIGGSVENDFGGIIDAYGKINKMMGEKENKTKYERIPDSNLMIDPTNPGAQPIQIPGYTPAPKTQTETQLISSSLAEKLGREPSANEILAEQNRLKQTATNQQADIWASHRNSNQTPFIDPEGNPVLVDLSDPNAQTIINQKHLKTQPVYNQSQSQGQLTDDAVTMAGKMFLSTGQMPALGRSSAARIKIANSAASQAKALGIDPQTLPGLQAEFKASKDALVNMKKSTENFSAFEKSMLKNMDYAVSLSENYKRSEFPPANKVINAVRTKTGDPQVVKFGTALYAAAMEFEKIRTAGTGITSAELSVEAQKKAEQIINAAQTHKQLQAVMEAMKVDAGNVMSARRGQIDSLKNELAISGITQEKTPKQSGGFDIDAINAELARRKKGK